MSPAGSLVETPIKQEIVDCCRRSVQYGLNFNTKGISAFGYRAPG
jgi:hypothetical protein